MSVLRFVRHMSTIPLVLIVAGMGCSDPVSPAPQGAFTVTFGNPIGIAVTCPATQPAEVRIGAVGGAQKAPVVDGDDGVTISCRVTQVGTGFRASGSIVRGNSQLYLAPVDVGEGMSNQGSVSVAGSNSAGKAYGPTADRPCTFSVIQASEGLIWMSFNCPYVETGSSENEKCSFYNGYVYFDNCEA